MAGRITTFAAVFFVTPPPTNVLSASLTDHFVQYLPSNTGGMMLEWTYGPTSPLSPWTDVR